MAKCLLVYDGCGFTGWASGARRPKAEFASRQKEGPMCRPRKGAVSSVERLAFRELEALARALLTVLLTFVRSRIASQQTRLLQARPQLRVDLDQRARDSQPDGACLSGRTAAVGENQNIELVRHFGCEQRLARNRARRFVGEIMLERPAVHRDLALTGSQEDARNRRLPPSCS